MLRCFDLLGIEIGIGWPTRAQFAVVASSLCLASTKHEQKIQTTLEKSHAQCIQFVHVIFKINNIDTPNAEKSEEDANFELRTKYVLYTDLFAFIRIITIIIIL